eukprot:EG_transcript_20585
MGGGRKGGKEGGREGRPLWDLHASGTAVQPQEAPSSPGPGGHLCVEDLNTFSFDNAPDSELFFVLISRSTRSTPSGVRRASGSGSSRPRLSGSKTPPWTDCISACTASSAAASRARGRAPRPPRRASSNRPVHSS